MVIFSLVVFLAIAALVGYVIMAYNRLVRLKHNVKAAWSNIDVLLKQRHDELPKLVTTCREYCLLYTSPSPRDATLSRMPSSA